MKKFTVCLLLVFMIFAVGCSAQSPVFSFGVWWWNDSLEYSFVDFASQNNINQIYYCNSTFDQNTAEFIEYSNNKNIKVFWLAGEYQWLEDNSKLIQKINNYTTYNSSFSNAKFSGIHLDIEPHQHPDFKIKHTDLIHKLINLAHTLKTNYPQISFCYDIPFWLDDNITFNNQTKPAYAHMIDIADGITLMSYRDTAQEIYDVSKDEIEYAISTNKTLTLGVETKSTEGDKVSFMEEGNKLCIPK